MKTDTNEEFTRDVRRSILLGSYIRIWGMPMRRVRANNPETGDVLEVYSFPPSSRNIIHRFATTGISVNTGRELMLALPEDLGGAVEKEVINYMLDISVYLIHTRPDAEVPFLVPESPLAPVLWKTRALLIDQARGEPEELKAIPVGDESVEVLWVVPIFMSEYLFIKSHGVEDFDAIAERSDMSLVEINREAFV